MSRRTVAGLLALALAALFVAVAAVLPVDYVTFRPGPTYNVLGSVGQRSVIDIRGHRSYADDGSLLMVTIYPSAPENHLDLITMLTGWLSPSTEVLPRDAVYGKDETNAQNQADSAAQMTNSQDSAVAAALNAAGIGYGTEVLVDGVSADGPSKGRLRRGDVLLAVDGTKVAGISDLVGLIRSRPPGTVLDLRVRRNDKQRDVSVTTAAAPDDPKASIVGISVRLHFDFPFDVVVRLPGTIGGPSAGMIFALSIYDLLTPGSLTGGGIIAGSGEISPDGQVGPIGGIGQKLYAAQRDGARLFLVAAPNCAEALRAGIDQDELKLVKVTTLQDAIQAVQAWTKDPGASLPQCTPADNEESGTDG